MHKPILASVPFLLVGIIQAKKPGAMLCPTYISTKSGSRVVFVISIPIPFKISSGWGRLNVSLVFEYVPSAPINSLHFISMFFDVFSSMLSSFLLAEVNLFFKNSSAPLSSAFFIISLSNLWRFITNAWALSPPRVSVSPDGEWMCAPFIVFCKTSFFGKLSMSNTLEVTKPAHLSGSPMVLCSSNIAVLYPWLAISFATYPPMGPPPITAASYCFIFFQFSSILSKDL